MAIELRQMEDVSFALGLATGPRWVGRKPKGCISVEGEKKYLGNVTASADLPVNET